MKVSLRLKGDFSRIKQLPGQVSKVNNSVTHRLALQAQRDMKDGVAKATSITANSIQINKIGDAHYSVGPTVKHGFWLEFGRSPGKAPPKNAILDWMKVKGIRVPADKQDAVAFLIGRKIAKKGTKPQPFVSPVARDKKWQMRYHALIQKEMDKVLA
jgi:hypothetical protein